MYVRSLWLLLGGILLGGEEFISYYEYGEMLYKNPRGVACAACHGDRGEGKKIARYREEDGKKKTLEAPEIRNVSFERFRLPFTPQGHSRKDIMPAYFLTDEEIRAIYDYIRTVNGNKTKGNENE
jgi:mono/diheme cytochrome c family protein